MKSKFADNLGLKLLSIIVAFVVWLVIINVIDPTTTKHFTSIPVDILNENVITSSNQVYEVESGKTVDLTVIGKRSFLEELTADDFYASADLSKLSPVNTAGIDVKLRKVTKENVELDWNNEVLRVSLEERSTQQFRVDISAEGDLAESYVLGEISTQPNIVEISGGKSKIRKIKSIGAVVSLNGQNSDFETEITPILYDSSGDVVDGTNVTFSQDMVKVKIEVLPTKTIPVYVEVKGKPADGYRHIQTDFKPESIQIAGSREQLERMKSLTIPISIEGAKKDVEEEVDLSQYVDAECRLADEFSTLSIRCLIEKNGKRTFSFVNSDIHVKNLPQELNFRYIDETQRHTIVISGGEEDLQNVTLTTLAATVDVQGLGEGTHTVEVAFDLPGRLKLKSKVKVEILLTRAEE